MTVLTVGIECRQTALEHTLRGAAAQTPFLVDDATLLLYLFLLERQSVGPVVEDEQTRVHDAFTGCGHVRDVVNRLVNGGVGIQVLAEFNTHALTPAHQFVALEVLGAVEGHVLQEVSQSALGVILLDGAHLLRNVELGTLLGPVVVANVVRQSIVQLADAHVRINGDYRHLHLLCSYRHDAGHGQHPNT